MLNALIKNADRAGALLRGAAPAVDLLFRLWIASVFFKAGLTKIGNWDATLYLFEYEYAVPVLPPHLAAFMGTAAELSLPLLLAFGLGTRLAAVALFVFNAVAVFSYPGLGEAGLREHTYWGLMLLATIFHGPGKFSLDHLIRKRLHGGKERMQPWAPSAMQ